MINTERQIYFDTMNRWARHQKLWWRIWHLWLRPSPYAPLSKRLLGYTWRLIIILAIATTLFLLISITQGSTHTQARLTSALRHSTGAHIAMDTPTWDNFLRVDRAVLVAPPNYPLLEAELRGIYTNAPRFRGVYSHTWNIDRANIRDAAISFFTATPSLKKLPPPTTSHHPLSLHWKTLTIANANILWNSDKTSAASLQHANLNLSPSPTGLVAEISNGTLTLPLLPQLHIKKLSCLCEPNRISIIQTEPSQVHIPKINATVLVSGGAAWLGNKMNTHLGVQINNLRPHDILPTTWHGEITGKMDLKTSLRTTDSNNTPPSLQFEATLTNGSIPQIKALNIFSSALRSIHLSKLSFTTAKASGTWSQQQLDLTLLETIETSSGLHVKISGQFTKDACTAELKLGFPTPTLQDPNLLLALGSREEKNGLYWYTIPLTEGPSILGQTWSNAKLPSLRSSTQSRSPDPTSPSEN